MEALKHSPESEIAGGCRALRDHVYLVWDGESGKSKPQKQVTPRVEFRLSGVLLENCPLLVISSCLVWCSVSHIRVLTQWPLPPISSVGCALPFTHHLRSEPLKFSTTTSSGFCVGSWLMKKSWEDHRRRFLHLPEILGQITGHFLPYSPLGGKARGVRGLRVESISRVFFP